MALCTTCFKDYISCGNETILVAGTLESITEYKWVIENKGAKYSGISSTDSGGQFEITVSSLPDGFLNPYAGVFTLTVFGKEDETQCTTITWNDSAYCDSYNCIEFEVVNGDHVKNTLGCPCDLI